MDALRARLLELSGQEPLSEDQQVALKVGAARLAEVLGVDADALGDALVVLAECWPSPLARETR